ncbi:unnamed protein product [Effrenium voratum]|uniref:Uncharacterized protein n=1 Tax=Effrenium voratum TaxID=2562239 RepID=A0AA36MWJ4_9DINO|nr:unnamed protein product [Effrenium voratum]
MLPSTRKSTPALPRSLLRKPPRLQRRSNGLRCLSSVRHEPPGLQGQEAGFRQGFVTNGRSDDKNLAASGKCLIDQDSDTRKGRSVVQTEWHCFQLVLANMQATPALPEFCAARAATLAKLTRLESAQIRGH